MKQITASEAAVALGCSPRTIQRAAKRLGIQKTGVQLLFTASQLRQIAGEINDGPGNPQIGAESAKGVAARWRPT